MTHEFSELTNNNLFELDKNLADFAKLKEFLENKYPWQCLGKNLLSFLQAWIQSIPIEKRRAGRISPHAVLEGNDIVVEDGVEIDSGAYVTGPTILLKGSSVRHGAFVRGGVLAAPGAVIGHTTEVKGSILLNNAKASHFAYVGDSILGVDTNLGAGTKLANLRFDHKNIQIRYQGQKIDSELKKFGAILGNRAQTGCNSVTNPGSILRPDKFLLPCKNGSGII